MGELNFVYPDLNKIIMPFFLLIVLVFGMIGTMIYFAKVELKNKGE